MDGYSIVVTGSLTLIRLSDRRVILPKCKKFREAGVLAMICDSTNVFKEGVSGSELAVQDSLDALLRSIPSGRIAVTTFASNIARLKTIAYVAERNDRHVVARWPIASPNDGGCEKSGISQ